MLKVDMSKMDGVLKVDVLAAYHPWRNAVMSDIGQSLCVNRRPDILHT